MKGILGSIGIAACVLISFQTEVVAQRGDERWNPEAQYARMYNPQTVETIQGTVSAVDMVTPVRGTHQGVHLVLETPSGSVSVHLGPAWYLENHDMQIAPRDRIVVKGSRVTMEGREVIIASEVRKANAVLRLRDKQGIPLWAGWRRDAGFPE